MIPILDWIFEGIVGWVSSIASQLLDAVSGIFLEALGTDMTAMEEYFPFVTKAYGVVQVTAYAILILIVVWQLFRAFGGPITEAENPWHLIVRGALFAFLIGYAKPIFCACLDIARAPYTSLMDLPMTGEDFTFAGVEQTLTNGLTTLVAGASVVGLILILILLIALGWNYFKLLLETVERYIVVGVLCYTSPLAFSMGASKTTSNVFKSWCRMVGSQLLLLVMNVWFLRGFSSSMGQFIGNGGALTTGKGSIFLWMFCALAYLKCAQRFDSYLASMGLNVAQTGSSMGMELMMAARVISGVGSGARSAGSVFGRAGGSATATGTGAAATGFASGFASRFSPNSYVRDAVVDGGTRMGFSGGAGFVGRVFGGIAARNGAALNGQSISSVASRTPGASGTIAGDIADRSLSNYMPHMQGFQLKDTQITGGHISTKATAPDGKAANVDMYSASQFEKPDVPHSVVTASDGSQWYQMASGEGRGAFYDAPVFGGMDRNHTPGAAMQTDAPDTGSNADSAGKHEGQVADTETGSRINQIPGANDMFQNSQISAGDQGSGDLSGNTPAGHSDGISDSAEIPTVATNAQGEMEAGAHTGSENGIAGLTPGIYGDQMAGAEGDIENTAAAQAGPTNDPDGFAINESNGEGAGKILVPGDTVSGDAGVASGAVEGFQGMSAISHPEAVGEIQPGVHGTGEEAAQAVKNAASAEALQSSTTLPGGISRMPGASSAPSDKAGISQTGKSTHLSDVGFVPSVNSSQIQENATPNERPMLALSSSAKGKDGISISQGQAHKSGASVAPDSRFAQIQEGGGSGGMDKPIYSGSVSSGGGHTIPEGRLPQLDSSGVLSSRLGKIQEDGASGGLERTASAGSGASHHNNAVSHGKAPQAVTNLNSGSKPGQVPQDAAGGRMQMPLFTEPALSETGLTGTKGTVPQTGASLVLDSKPGQMNRAGASGIQERTAFAGIGSSYNNHSVPEANVSYAGTSHVHGPRPGQLTENTVPGRLQMPAADGSVPYASGITMSEGNAPQAGMASVSASNPVQIRQDPVSGGMQIPVSTGSASSEGGVTVPKVSEFGMSVNSGSKPGQMHQDGATGSLERSQITDVVPSRDTTALPEGKTLWSGTSLKPASESNPIHEYGASGKMDRSAAGTGVSSNGASTVPEGKLPQPGVPTMPGSQGSQMHENVIPGGAQMTASTGSIPRTSRFTVSGGNVSQVGASSMSGSNGTQIHDRGASGKTQVTASPGVIPPARGYAVTGDRASQSGPSIMPGTNSLQPQEGGVLGRTQLAASPGNLSPANRNAAAGGNVSQVGASIMPGSNVAQVHDDASTGRTDMDASSGNISPASGNAAAGSNVSQVRASIMTGTNGSQIHAGGASGKTEMTASPGVISPASGNAAAGGNVSQVGAFGMPGSNGAQVHDGATPGRTDMAASTGNILPVRGNAAAGGNVSQVGPSIMSGNNGSQIHTGGNLGRTGMAALPGSILPASGNAAAGSNASQVRLSIMTDSNDAQNHDGGATDRNLMGVSTGGIPSERGYVAANGKSILPGPSGTSGPRLGQIHGDDVSAGMDTPAYVGSISVSAGNASHIETSYEAGSQSDQIRHEAESGSMKVSASDGGDFTDNSSTLGAGEANQSGTFAVPGFNSGMVHEEGVSGRMDIPAFAGGVANEGGHTVAGEKTSHYGATVMRGTDHDNKHGAIESEGMQMPTSTGGISLADGHTVSEGEAPRFSGNIGSGGMSVSDAGFAAENGNAVQDGAVSQYGHSDDAGTHFDQKPDGDIPAENGDTASDGAASRFHVSHGLKTIPSHNHGDVESDGLSMTEYPDGVASGSGVTVSETPVHSHAEASVPGVQPVQIHDNVVTAGGEMPVYQDAVQQNPGLAEASTDMPQYTSPASGSGNEGIAFGGHSEGISSMQGEMRDDPVPASGVNAAEDFHTGSGYGGAQTHISEPVSDAHHTEDHAASESMRHASPSASDIIGGGNTREAGSDHPWDGAEADQNGRENVYSRGHFSGCAEAPLVAATFPSAQEGTILRTVGEGVIEASLPGGGNTLWYNSAFYQEPDAPHTVMEAANGVQWYAMQQQAQAPHFESGDNAARYNQAAFMNFMPGYVGQVANVDGTHRMDGHFEVHNADGSGTAFYDAARYAAPRGAYQVLEDARGNQWYAIRGEAAVDRKPVFENGQAVYIDGKLRTVSVETVRYKQTPAHFGAPQKRADIQRKPPRRKQ